MQPWLSEVKENSALTIHYLELTLRRDYGFNAYYVCGLKIPQSAMLSESGPGLVVLSGA